MLDFMAGDARWAPECQVHQPEHVERRHQSGNVPNDPQQVIRNALTGPRLPQDFVLREEAGKWRNPCNRQRRNQHRAVGDGDLVR